MSYFNFENKRIYYSETGTGKPLLLLHGNTASSNMFYLAADRESSKLEEGARMFYKYMHGEDWESVVDNDTLAIVEHDKTIGKFFHRSLTELKPEILFTGSKEDEFISAMEPDYFERVYGGMLKKIEHGSMYLFETGGHPAMLSSADEFVKVSKAFLMTGIFPVS